MKWEKLHDCSALVHSRHSELILAGTGFACIAELKDP
jgi:hypothetical protein